MLILLAQGPKKSISNTKEHNLTQTLTKPHQRPIIIIYNDIPGELKQETKIPLL